MGEGIQREHYQGAFGGLYTICYDQAPDFYRDGEDLFQVTVVENFYVFNLV